MHFISNIDSSGPVLPLAELLRGRVDYRVQIHKSLLRHLQVVGVPMLGYVCLILLVDL
jgi:hypothetical protein